MKKQVKLKVENNISCIISGKYYFDNLKKYLLNFSGTGINNKDLRNALVKGYDITSLDFLKSAILKVKDEYSCCGYTVSPDIGNRKIDNTILP